MCVLPASAYAGLRFRIAPELAEGRDFFDIYSPTANTGMVNNMIGAGARSHHAHGRTPIPSASRRL